MAKTIFEILQEANTGVNQSEPTEHYRGRWLLNSAVQLLAKGYSLTEKFRPLMEKHGNDAENVPVKKRLRRAKT